MAAPQVAGLAAYLWTLRPNLTGSQVAQIIKVPDREPDICNDGSHVIDAYATILSADTGFGADEHPARSAILDVLNEPPLVGDPALDLVFGDCAIKSPHVVAFGDCEVAAFLANLMKPNAGKVADYSRYDLNGDGFTGGLAWPDLTWIWIMTRSRWRVFMARSMP